LLVNARNSGKVLDFDRVIQEMREIASPFLEVWVIAFVGPDDIKVVRVAPGALSIDLKIRTELEKAKAQAPFIQRGKRGTGTEIRDLGPAFLPIPERD
jgi:hypothetical protein